MLPTFRLHTCLALCAGFPQTQPTTQQITRCLLTREQPQRLNYPRSIPSTQSWIRGLRAALRWLYLLVRGAQESDTSLFPHNDSDPQRQAAGD